VITSITTAELAQLTGEVLPERAVLSTVAPTNFGGGGSEASANAFALSPGGGDHHASTVIAYSCVAANNQQNAGLLSVLGLGSQNPTVTLQCTPAAIVNNN
jgi:hypothetical protein